MTLATYQCGQYLFDRYPEYVSTGIKWLDCLPAHWGLTKIKYLASFTSGGTPPTEELKYWNGDLPWCSSKDMKRSIIDTTEDTISEEAVLDRRVGIANEGDVLLGVRSGILRHTIPVAMAGRRLAFNQDIKGITFNRKPIDARYFTYLIQGNQEPLLVEWRKQGATVESLEIELVANTVFPVPPSAEQQAIVAFLDRETARIDAMIEKKERLIALLEEKRTALISHAVTKGLDPTAPMKDSGIDWLGEIPVHCKVVPLRWYIDISSGDFISNVDFDLDQTIDRWIPVIGGNGLMGYANKSNVHSPTLAIGRVGALCGNVHVVPNPAWITDNALMLRKIKGFYLEYLYHILLEINLNQWASQTAQPLVTGSLVKSQYAAMPPVNEQISITNYCMQSKKDINAIIARNQEVILKMCEFRTAIISAAVTGKIDVRKQIGGTIH